MFIYRRKKASLPFYESNFPEIWKLMWESQLGTFTVLANRENGHFVDKSQYLMPENDEWGHNVLPTNSTLWFIGYYTEPNIYKGEYSLLNII